MIVKKYKSVVISVKNPVAGIYTVEFKTLNAAYGFLPGQFLHLALDEDYDGVGQWPESRCFSMQSSPNEDNIRITYAIKGRFTKMMEKQLKIGSEVWLKLPYGNLFTQPHNKFKSIFIAGGTGITPFLSLFTNMSFNEYINPQIHLGFRTKQFNIYEKELEDIRNFNPFLYIYYEDDKGLIDIARIFQDNGVATSYFISGPPKMIKIFSQYLATRGVSTSNILSDSWE